jgi:hypothetical protein
MTLKGGQAMTRTQIALTIALAATLLSANSLPGSPTTSTPTQDLVDPHLAVKVTLARKGMALSDLCDQLRTETGVHLLAGASVADEKVTLFCEGMPLRDIMRQLARPFGYIWLRSQRKGEYRYELTLDLRSQLLEEELRNRNRNAALLALEKEIERYRPYLDLSPDEALAQAAKAPPEQKELLTRLAGPMWGLVQMYARLTASDMAALRAGRAVLFSPTPGPGQQLLPPEVARGVLQSERSFRYAKRDTEFVMGTPEGLPEGQPLTAFPDARPVVSLILRQTGPGQFILAGGIGYTISGDPGVPLAAWQEAADVSGFGIFTASSGKRYTGSFFRITNLSLASGTSPGATRLRNEVANAGLARDPALQKRVTVHPIPSCPPLAASAPHGSPTASNRTAAAERKVTTADVLEAVHRETGMPIVADYYTRLYRPEQVSLQGRPLFKALNELADTMRLRWTKDRCWLQFRSATFYNDRLQEVPNRLLARWSEARRQHGMLMVEDLLEITQLSDSELDAAEMAEGARLCWDLEEWDLARAKHLRPHLRHVAGLLPDQRREAMRAVGLPFTRLTLAQQQQFLSMTLGFPANTLQVTPEDLAKAYLRVEYFVPGGLQWVAPDEPGAPLRLEPRAPISEELRARLLQSGRRLNPNGKEEQILAQPEPDLQITYTIGSSEARLIRRRIGIRGGGIDAP